MTIGLPASGKSTWAREQVAKSKGNTKRVNKDDLRDMIDAGKWGRNNEKHILETRNAIVRHYLNLGNVVIVDDTNLAPQHGEALRAIAKEAGATFEIKSFLDVPVKECIERDLKRPVSVGERVIKQMYNNYLKPAPVAYKPAEGLPKAIIVDIDGTLAHMTGRSPYDYTQVHTDVIDETVRDLVKMLSETFKVLVVSGRDDTCYTDTVNWLRDNSVVYDELMMRSSARLNPDGSKPADTIIKREIFDEFIKDRFHIELVLDDRDQVVNMWRNDLGLKVLQVAEGDF
jgi:predicted kinase